MCLCKQIRGMKYSLWGKNYVQAKLKKIREKYGDQDDEERQIRMEILAVRAQDMLCVNINTTCYL